MCRICVVRSGWLFPPSDPTPVLGRAQFDGCVCSSLVDDVRVGGREKSRPAEVDWIDLGRSDGPAGRPRRWWRSRWWLLLIPAVIALVVIGVVRHGVTGSTPTASRTSLAASASSRSSGAATPPAAAPVSVTRVGRGLLDVPAAWQLFGLGPDGVVRVQLAAGQITRTSIPRLNLGSGVSFVVGPSEVIIRSEAGTAGYVVPDGRPAEPGLPGDLADADAAFPGPDPAQLWIESGEPPELTLVSYDGKPTGTSVPVPSVDGSISTDNAGGLIFSDFGGAYAIRPNTLHRITSGALLAAGPVRWLVAECDDQHRCSMIVIDQARGTRRVLGAATQGDQSLPHGVISPDGATAALLVDTAVGTPELYLLDLASGSATTVPASGPCDQQAFVWSPDSRWLFEAGRPGYLCIVDRHTGRPAKLDASLPQITQLAFRSTAR
jgi:hypothetical protein